MLQIAHVDSGHGMDHARRVAQHAVLSSRAINIPARNHLQVVLAAWLHDVDDHKFPNLRQLGNAEIYPNSNYPNAQRLMTRYFTAHVAEVLEMIDAVSCSQNGIKLIPVNLHISTSHVTLIV